MILTNAGPQSQHIRSAEAVKLLKEADSIDRFSECGWAYAMGWKGEGLASKMTVLVHANSHEEIDRALGLVNDSYGGLRRG